MAYTLHKLAIKIYTDLKIEFNWIFRPIGRFFVVREKKKRVLLESYKAM